MKSGGVTISHLRFGPSEIKGSYQVRDADYIACHNQAYVSKYPLADELKTGGAFLLNTVWSDEVPVPAAWKDAVPEEKEDKREVPEFFRKVLFKMARQEGGELPVSAFAGRLRP